MQKVVILGLGISGQSAIAYLSNSSSALIGVDRFPEKCTLSGISLRSETDPIELEGVDFVIKSPGILNSHPWVQKALEKNIPITSELDLAFKELKKACKTVVGVTGSNGKTTTTLLITHILQKKGMKAVAAGNVGTPLLSQLNASANIYVVEMSSFQLESICPNPLMDFAMILNITPNHLDRHSSFEEYVRAKFCIQRCLKEGASLFMSSQVKMFSSYFRQGGQQEFFDLSKERVETILPLSYREGRSRLYPHDLDNFSAAYAIVSRLGVSDVEFSEAVASFQKPPHRVEFVRTWKGVEYVNDSKATSVDAVMKAVKAMPSRVVLIAGGVDKGGSFQEWIPLFRQKVACVFAMGDAARRMVKELTPDVNVVKVSSLEEGVEKASKAAQKGEIVLLSPGCSSFNQFKDYQERGDRFKEMVFAL